MTDIAANIPADQAASDRNWTMAKDNEALKQKAAAAKEAVADLAGEAGRYAAHRVGDAKDTAGQWAMAAKDRAQDYTSQVSDFVQRNPYKSLAIAAGLGVLTGMLFRADDHRDDWAAYLAACFLCPKVTRR